MITTLLEIALRRLDQFEESTEHRTMMAMVDSEAISSHHIKLMKLNDGLETLTSRVERIEQCLDSAGFNSSNAGDTSEETTPNQPQTPPRRRNSRYGKYCLGCQKWVTTDHDNLACIRNDYLSRSNHPAGRRSNSASANADAKHPPSNQADATAVPPEYHVTVTDFNGDYVTSFTTDNPVETVRLDSQSRGGMYQYKWEAL
jgi:hypothetical protein